VSPGIAFASRGVQAFENIRTVLKEKENCEDRPVYCLYFRYL
jgi:hypothetical protein